MDAGIDLAALTELARSSWLADSSCMKMPWVLTDDEG